MKFNPIRMFWPRLYIRMGMAACEKKYKTKLHSSPDLTSTDRANLKQEYYHNLREWDEWLTTLDDSRLIKNARKADVYLDDIPFAEYDKDDMHSIKSSHYYYGAVGDKLLDPVVRRQLTQSYRKRLPEYRKERRETVGLWFKGGGVLIGVIGALTGLVAVYNKCGVGN